MRAAAENRFRIGAPLRVTLFVVSVALVLIALRPLLARTQLVRGQLQRGYFEEIDAHVRLALDDHLTDRFIFPGLSRDQAGDLSVPPGTTAVLPLEDASAYRISAEGGELLPNVVFGAAVTTGTPPSSSIAAPLQLEVQDGRLQLTAWDASRPWQQESLRLQRLGKSCGGAAGPLGIIVAVAGERLSVHLGECALDVSLSAVHGGAGRPTIAVVAGLSWDLVRRNDSAWKTELKVNWPVALAATLLATAQVGVFWLAVNPITAAATAVTLAAVSLWAAMPAVACVFIALAAGLAVALGFGIARLVRAPTRVSRALLLAAATAMVSLWILLSQRGAPSLATQDSTGSVCLLTGYSTANDSALRSGTRGTGTGLATGCAACAGSVATQARSGATFSFIRDVACASPAPVRPGGTLILLGGTNDDLLSWFDARSDLMQMVVQFRDFANDTYNRRPGLENLIRLETETSFASLRVLDHQDAVLRQIVGCARSADFTLLFAHDFLITDLVTGRPQERQAMVTRRRAVVEAEGARFVDLLDAFRDEAGVSWFNDFIHPSVLGHRRIAELICDNLPRA